VRVRWLRTALANLDAEAEYIAEDNPVAARRVVQKILRAVDLLKKNPAMGRAGRVAGTRELVVAETPYIIPYRVRGDAVKSCECFTRRGSGRRGFEGRKEELYAGTPRAQRKIETEFREPTRKTGEWGAWLPFSFA